MIGLPPRERIPPYWELCDAIQLVRRIYEPLASVGWYTGITAGVLNKGYSNHDLDLTFIPRYAARLKDLENGLKALGWRKVRDAETMRKGWKTPDPKYVEEWSCPDGRRVDIIVLRTQFS